MTDIRSRRLPYQCTAIRLLEGEGHVDAITRFCPDDESLCFQESVYLCHTEVL